MRHRQIKEWRANDVPHEAQYLNGVNKLSALNNSHAAIMLLVLRLAFTGKFASKTPLGDMPRLVAKRNFCL